MDDRDRRWRVMHERLTRMLEEVGFPHTIARVYTALTLAHGEGLSAGDLAQELEISKASVSNATQFLAGTDLVERYRVRGSRKAHYRILKDVWGTILAKKFAAIGYIRRTVEEAITLEPGDKARARLEEMHDVYSFFETEFAEVMSRWNERKKA
ncbi:MAG TPA: MarR family transcriptional regulator [Acidimicrobiia bacterium]|nr:MarR family transcriptional regulator [Acidimicrobiia bacterium]